MRVSPTTAGVAQLREPLPPARKQLLGMLFRGDAFTHAVLEQEPGPGASYEAGRLFPIAPPAAAEYAMPSLPVYTANEGEEAWTQGRRLAVPCIDARAYCVLRAPCQRRLCMA